MSPGRSSAMMRGVLHAHRPRRVHATVWVSAVAGAIGTLLAAYAVAIIVATFIDIRQHPEDDMAGIGYVLAPILGVPALFVAFLAFSGYQQRHERVAGLACAVLSLVLALGLIGCIGYLYVTD